jgi:hypothetical protein
MKTESWGINKKLYLLEGKEWLLRKYGITDRWSFERLVHLSYKEFFKRSPDYRELEL